MVKMRRQTDADVIRIVKQYKEAGVGEVEGVLNEYLALADDYERRGWGRYGAPGWIDELRSDCEARLAAFCKAVGKEDAYQLHARRAVADRKRANPNSTATAEDLCDFVERLDAANIQPRWRRDVAAMDKPSSNGTPR
jgi:hypothetical protein